MFELAPLQHRSNLLEQYITGRLSRDRTYEHASAEQEYFPVPTGYADICIPALTGSVDHTAHHCHRYRPVNIPQCLLNPIGHSD